VESVFFILRSSSVFLFVAQYYRKDRARTGAGQKIVCKLPLQKGNLRRGGLPVYPPMPSERPLFERNVQSGVNETWKNRVEGGGSRVEGKKRADSPQPTAKDEKPTMNLYCRL
jgi:hypothetical protein